MPISVSKATSCHVTVTYLDFQVPFSLCLAHLLVKHSVSYNLQVIRQLSLPFVSLTSCSACLWASSAFFARVSAAFWAQPLIVLVIGGEQMWTRFNGAWIGGRSEEGPKRMENRVREWMVHFIWCPCVCGSHWFFRFQHNLNLEPLADFLNPCT